jgi:hypothetical protein
MKRFPACASAIGLALIIGAAFVPLGSRATADVTGDQIDPAQPVPDPDDYVTYCSDPCSGSLTCSSSTQACCCQPVGGGAKVCSCKSPEDCKNTSTEHCS